MKSLKSCRLALLLLLTLAILPFGAKPAQAIISIVPTLVVIEGRDRFAEMTLINTGDKTITYDIEWRFYRMNEGKVPGDGQATYIDADSSLTEFDLTQNIVYTPRRVTLPPKEAQKVRLSLRLAGEPPPPGDYRGHLSFRQVKDPGNAGPPQVAPETPDGRRGFNTRVGVGVSISVPVIYRVGESDASASIGDIELNYNQSTSRIEARVPVSRSESAYGTLGSIKVYYKPPGGAETLVGEVRNANIFPEINHRLFTAALKTENLAGGSLRVSYQYFDEKKKRPHYDEKIFPVGN